MFFSLLSSKSQKGIKLAALAAGFFIFAGLFATPFVAEQSSRQQYPYNPAPQNAHQAIAQTLRVILPVPEAKNGHNYGYGPGMELELLEHFVQQYKFKVQFIYVESCLQGLELLRQRRANLMLGFGGEPGPGYENIVNGPSVMGFSPVAVSLPEGTEQADLLLPKTRLNRFVYPEQAQSEVKDLDNAILLDPASFALMIPLYGDISPVAHLDCTVGSHWFWNSLDRQLSHRLKQFWADQEVQSLSAELIERYYGFLPDKPKKGALLEIEKAINESVGKYRADIVKAAKDNNIDPLLLTAVIFQESRFDPQACSYTGVRGIMQLTLVTAEELNVDRTDPSQAIMGGARYLRKIMDSLAFVEGVNEWDKWRLSLAGFNQGPTVLRRALRAAADEGLRQNWPTMREYYGELQDKGLAGPSFRPGEAVNYVESICYYYYILSSLAGIDRPEHEDLAGLLAGLP